MALSNAERQARYRARLKESAPLDALGGRVRELVDKAVEALWNIFSRPAPDGAQWEEIDGIPTLADYRRHLAADPDRLVATCRDLLWVPHLLTEAERQTVHLLVDMADALALRPGSTPPK